MLNFYHLAHFLGSDQPLYGLQAKGLQGQPLSSLSVELIAADYLKEIRTVWPQDPYRLGYSSGGKIAFGIAQQLTAQGQQVELLALFDTRGPDWIAPLPFQAWAALHVRNLWRLKPQQKWAYFKKRFLRRVQGDQQPVTPVDPLSPVRAVYEQADREYVLRVYPGRAILLRANADFHPWGVVDPFLGWAPFVAGGLEFQEIPGHHTNILEEPNIKGLAEKLKACLARV